MNKKTERKQNLRLIVEALQQFGPVAQIRLKEFCNLQASTVSYLINDLKQQNLVVDIGKEDTQGRVGKPGNMVGLNNREAAFLGMYVEDTCLHIYLVGVDGTAISSDCIEYAPNDVKEVIFSAIEKELQKHDNLRGIGIAIKAIVYNDGHIKSGTRQGKEHMETSWDMMNLASELRSTFCNMPIILENDANSAAELYRQEHGCDNFVLYMLNDIPFGIGCGLTIDGKVQRGRYGAAGEFFVKDLKVKQVRAAADKKENTLGDMIPFILPHMLQTAYLLDTERFVLTGSLFRDASEEGIRQAKAQLSVVPVPVEIDYGSEQHLNPARGVALRAIHNYVDAFLEEMVKR